METPECLLGRMALLLQAEGSNMITTASEHKKKAMDLGG